MDLTILPHGSTKVEGGAGGTSSFPPQKQQQPKESLKAPEASCGAG